MFAVDIGQGDASVVLGPKVDGRRMALVIDAGDRSPDGGKIVEDLLVAEGITTLDYVVLSHHDSDHLGGFVTVSNSTSLLWTCGGQNGQQCQCAAKSLFPKIAVYDSGKDPQTDGTVSSKEWTKCVPKLTSERGVAYHSVEDGDHLGDELDLGGGFKAVIVSGDGHVLGTSGRIPKAESRNEESVAVLVTNGTTDLLITGDLIGQRGSTSGPEDAALEAALGQALVARGIDVEVLRTGHHGAANATEDSFIAAIKPEVALISAGNTNTHGHPTCRTLATLKKNNVGLVVQTELGKRKPADTNCNLPLGTPVVANGTIRVDVSGSRYRVSSYGDTSPANGNPTATFAYDCAASSGCAVSTGEPPEDEPQECCRVCSSGKPCGDSCIASTSTCNKPPGCACASN